MATRPSIPARYSSLIPSSGREEVERLKQRSVSARSQMSIASSTEDFIDAKIETIEADLAINDRFREFTRKRIALSDDQEYEVTLNHLESEKVDKERELIAVKRQKKTLIDDIDEMRPHYDKLEAAYASVLSSKIMSASSDGHKEKKAKKNKQSLFSDGVLRFYNAERHTESGAIEKYCHLIGWLPAKDVKCAHIIPKSVQSDELAYLYGIGEAVLSEPRNGITLHSTIEKALDNGRMVIVPEKSPKGDEIIWRCVVVDKIIHKDMVTSGWWWKDLDGKVLEFLTPNRPARRYLYLRFVTTFLNQRKKDKRNDKKDANESTWHDAVQAKGILWATPGPYLRGSMLQTLARQLSDHFLPEAFDALTFGSTEGSPQRSEEEEKDLAMSLSLRIQDAQAESSSDIEGSDSEDDGE